MACDDCKDLNWARETCADLGDFSGLTLLREFRFCSENGILSAKATTFIANPRLMSDRKSSVICLY